jgi:hypothetical protein
MTSVTQPVPFLVAEHETLLGFGCKRNFVPQYGIREKRSAFVCPRFLRANVERATA